MNFDILIGILIFLLVIFVFGILRLALGLPKDEKKRNPLRRQRGRQNSAVQTAFASGSNEIDIKVRKEPDGLHFIVREGIVPEDPEEDEVSLFPDLLGIAEGPEDSTGLSDDFWMEVANLPNNTDPMDRERIATILHMANFIERDEIPVLAAVCEQEEEDEEEESAEDETKKEVKNEQVESEGTSHPSHVADPHPPIAGEYCPEAPIPHPLPEPVHQKAEAKEKESPVGENSADEFERHVFRF